MYTLQLGAKFIWVLVWVDDCVITDNDTTLRNKFVSDLNRRFPLTDKGHLEWILGVKIARDRAKHILTMSQELYISDLVKRFGSLTSGLTKRFDSPADSTVRLSPEQSPTPGTTEYDSMASYHNNYMSLVGAYLWLANVTRPEISYITSQLARFVSCPGQVHYKAALRVLIYLESTSARILRFAPNLKLGLQLYVDSDWGVKFSVSGAIVTYMGCAMYWFSKTQRSVSLSSTQAEYFAAMMLARDGIHLRDVLKELDLDKAGPLTIRSDNKGVIDLSFDPVAFKKTKHILRAAEFLRDLCLREFYALLYIASGSNPADIFTKVLPLADFRAQIAILDNLSRVA